MKLSEYLAADDARTVQAIAHSARLRWQTVAAIAKGRSVPRVETARRIEAATGGEVTVADLLGLTEGEAAE